MSTRGWLAGTLPVLLAALPVVDYPCVPEPVFPADCAATLEQIGGATLERADEGFVNTVSPLVDPLLLLRRTGDDGAVLADGRLYALNPAADRVRVFDTRDGLTPLRDVAVCSRPGALAQSESGDRVFVACHGSAAVAVIETDTDRVVATLQDRDGEGRPRLQEPMGMVAVGELLYVTSSQNNRLAVIDLTSRSFNGYIPLPGRDPRAIVPAGNGRFLVVANFLAGNRTEPRVEPHPAARDPAGSVGEVCASLLGNPGTAPLLDESSERFMDSSHPRYPEVAECYLFAQTFGSSSRIVREPRREDHDVVVVERASGRVVFTSDSLAMDLGAVNYGLAVAPGGRRLYLVSTRARNDLGHAFGDRPVINQLTLLDLDPSSGALAVAGIVDLDAEALAPGGTGRARAPIPSAVVAHGDGVLITSTGADAVVVTGADGAPTADLPAGFGPRGIVVDGSQAYVFNATGQSVSRLDLASGRETARADLGPNPLTQRERIGARLFHSAGLSANGSLACASCHPDGHQDGLVWELNDRDGLRATLPVAGIAETAPYHWDGSKCNLHDIVQDTVGDLFRNPRRTDPCRIQALVDYMSGLARPGSPHRAWNDRLSDDAALGSLVVHRMRFKDANHAPQTCSQGLGGLGDPATEPALARALGDPRGETFVFNGGGGPVPATRASESCGLANCHVTPRLESDGFRNGDPSAGHLDGYQAVSLDGAWDRETMQHDGRTTRHSFLRALSINREFHGAPPLGRDALAAQAFNDANFRHPEYHFDGSAATHGFRLTDAMTRFMLEEASGASAAVGLTVVVDRNPADSGDALLLQAMVEAATAGKIALKGVGTLGGRLTALTYRPADGALLADVIDDDRPLRMSTLRSGLVTGDAIVFRGARLPGAGGGGRPGLLAVERARSPILCSEGYARYPATLRTDERDARLLIRAIGVEPGTRVLIDGAPQGAVLDDMDGDFGWSLPRAPGTPGVLTLQLMSAEGVLSNSLPLPIVAPVVSPAEPAEVTAGNAAGLTVFRWPGQFGVTGPGTTYDVFRGTLDTLRGGRGADGECITPRGWSRPEVTDGKRPTSGHVLYYLVRAQNQAGVSGWGNAARDAALAASGRSCPILFPD